ncbi:probable ATP-dependent RNA helicase ddx20 [Schistocerca gregaria]|uniref:probable ATP-dependent RNA helicase ddx20 n=1 Tax=Schistocerca gregaria TaxID=7010 RepID=UPI00211EA4AD|nr:probable ATP-dependent RNA helicase ddx20 [Schistocerca gregaria]
MKLGKQINGLLAQVFIGGMPFAKDIQKLSPCNVVVGTVGRIKQLIKYGHLDTQHIKLLIVDEADKIFEAESLEKTTMAILEALPPKKQFMAFSATYAQAMIDRISSLMNHPEIILTTPTRPILEGVRQYYEIIEFDKDSSDVNANHSSVFYCKTKKLVEILAQISFHQCIIFCNHKIRSKWLTEQLNSMGWPTSFISGYFRQKERCDIMTKLREFRIRILVSTDLISRGVDIERINLVINMDMPIDAETYLHRIGRTGRFGTYGVAINLVSVEEKKFLDQFASHYQCVIEYLPKVIPAEFYYYDLSSEQEKKQSRKLEIIKQNAKSDLIDTEPILEKEKTKKKRQKKDCHDTGSEHGLNNNDSSTLFSQDHLILEEGDGHSCEIYPPRPPPLPGMPNIQFQQYIKYIHEFYFPSLKQLMLKK